LFAIINKILQQVWKIIPSVYFILCYFVMIII
jgi:hypothetical protein